LYERHRRGEAVEAFVRAIQKASQVLLENPLNTPLIPSWKRVSSAIPGVLDMLKAAVDEDNR
jgi:glucosyl-3-phosphoglycerate synthase